MEDFEDLLFISLSVFQDRFSRELFSGGRPARGIADQAREVTNHENHNVAQILKVLHLANENGVSDVNVRGGRIKSCFYTERFSTFLRSLQLFEQLFFANNFNGASPEVLELLINRNCPKVVHLSVLWV